MRVAYIMRGIPGSGKSTLARHLVRHGGVIHSTDDYFFERGVYRFDPKKLREYHDRNFAAFCESLAKGKLNVVCDNTNAKRWQFERYAEAAIDAGYIVSYVSMPHIDPEEAARRTLHGVPEHVIRVMIETWEY